MAFNPLSRILNIGSRLVPQLVRRLVTVGRSAADIAGTLARPIVNLFGGSRTQVESEVERIAVAYEQVERGATEIAVGDLSRIVDPLTMPDAVTRQRRLFNWVIKGTIRNNTTGEVFERYLTVATDQLLSPNEAVDAARNMFAEEYTGDLEDIVSVEFDSVTRQTERLI